MIYISKFIGDDRGRISYVINRSEDIIKENDLNIDWNILYTIISFHDIRQDNEEKEHELLSAKMMYNDKFLKEFFTEEQMIIIKEAIEDQRAHSKNVPRSIYGKILSSASRNSSVEQCLEKSYKYGKKKNPNASDDDLFENAYIALLNKFGEGGYAKFYFKDSTYEQFLSDIRQLLSDKSKFIDTQKKFVYKMQGKKKI